MSITGNLNTMELSELLQWLSQSTKTGTLVIDNGRVRKKIFFKRGRIFSSASSDPKEYLGHFLVSHGLISELELSQAIEMQESNRMLLGKILVTIGAVSEPDLQRLLRLKAEESIYDLFSWPEAEFRFVDGELPEHALIPLDLDVAAIIFEGVRRADEWRRVQEVIPSMQAIPVAVGDILEDTGLDPGARKILSLVNDDRTVEELAVQTHSGEYRTCKVLYDQAMKGRLKVVRPRWDGIGPDSSAGAAEDEVSSQALLRSAEKHLAAGKFEVALRHLRAARSLVPDSRTVAQALKDAQAKIQAEVEAAGVRLEAIPKLAVDLENITKLDLTPQEGFILTRINGTYDLKSILKISPMDQLDGLLVVRRLLTAGHVHLE